MAGIEINQNIQTKSTRCSVFLKKNIGCLLFDK